MRKLVFLVLILSQIVLIFLSIKIPEFGSDFFWHLKIGLDWFNKGLSPLFDHYSISHFGERYNHLPPFLFQAIIAFFHNLFGLEAAALIYKLSIISLSCFFLCYFARGKQISFEYIFLGLVLIVYAIVWRLLPRPELLSYVFIILYIFIIESLRTKNSYYLVSLLFILQVLWINLHASPFGFVLFGAYIIEKIFLVARNKNFFKNIRVWVILGLCYLFLGFLNPFFSHPLIIALNFSDVWRNLITEHRPVDLVNEYYLTFFSLTLLCLFTIYKTKRYYAMIIVFVFIYKGYNFNKLYPFLFVASSVFLVLSLDDISKEKTIFLKKINLNIIYWLLLGLVISSQFVYILFYNIEKMNYNELSVNMPVEAMDYIDKVGIKQGKVYNNYNAGGYVVYRMPEGMRNTIDGRTNLLFSAAEMDKAVSSSISPSVLYYFDKKLSFDYAIAYYNHLYDGSFETILRSGIFNLEYAGKYSAFFSKGKNKFEAARIAIIEPACIDSHWLKKIESELELTKETHKAEDLLPRILNFFNGYFKAEDKSLYIINNKMDEINSIFELRAMAILLEKHNKPMTAIRLYQLVPVYLLTAKDSIFLLDLISKSKIIEEQKKLAYENIKWINRNYSYLSKREKSILDDILKKYKTNKSFSRSKYFKKLKERLSVDLKGKKISPNDREIFKYRCDQKSELIFASEEAS